MLRVLRMYDTHTLFAPEPLVWIADWHRKAEETGEDDPDAMTLSTCTPEGGVSARVVLLRGLDDRGLRFFTNYQSRKGTQLAHDAAAALTMYWPRAKRQIRIEGRAERVGAEVSDAYFASRPRGHQIGAWASRQSETIASLEDLEARWKAIETQYADREVPRPAHWGGYRVVPDRVEFWTGRSNRLHERVLYVRAEGGWKIERLAP